MLRPGWAVWVCLDQGGQVVHVLGNLAALARLPHGKARARISPGGRLGGHGVRPYGHRPAPLLWAISTEFPGRWFQAETAWVWPLRVGSFAPLRMTGAWRVGWADTGSAPTIVTPSTFLGAGSLGDLANSPSGVRPVRRGTKPQLNPKPNHRWTIRNARLHRLESGDGTCPVTWFSPSGGGSR